LGNRTKTGIFFSQVGLVWRALFKGPRRKKNINLLRNQTMKTLILLSSASVFALMTATANAKTITPTPKAASTVSSTTKNGLLIKLLGGAKTVAATAGETEGRNEGASEGGNEGGSGGSEGHGGGSGGGGDD